MKTAITVGWLVAIVLMLALQASPVYADGIVGTVTPKGSKVNVHVPATRAGSKGCVRADSNTPLVQYYFDGDGTSPQVAYSDYLEDLQHWYTVTDRACVPVPQMFPDK